MRNTKRDTSSMDLFSDLTLGLIGAFVLIFVFIFLYMNWHVVYSAYLNNKTDTEKKNLIKLTKELDDYEKELRKKADALNKKLESMKKVKINNLSRSELNKIIERIETLKAELESTEQQIHTYQKKKQQQFSIYVKKMESIKTYINLEYRHDEKTFYCDYNKNQVRFSYKRLKDFLSAFNVGSGIILKIKTNPDHKNELEDFLMESLPNFFYEIE